MIRVNPLITASALFVGLCTGCAGIGLGEQPVDRRIPFHVAVVGRVEISPPVSLPEAAASVEITPNAVAPVAHPNPVELASAPVDTSLDDLFEATTMRMSIDSRLLSAIVARELAEHAFTRVTPISSSSGERAVTDPQLSRSLRESGADLVMFCELDYQPEISYARTSPVSLNLLLFYLGGPFIWVLDEYTYRAKAELRVSLHDLGGVDRKQVRPGDPRSRIFEAQAEFPGVETDFIDRVGWDPETEVSSYVASLFTSTFLVGQESDGIAALVSQEALSSLGSQVAEALVAQRDDVLRAGSEAQLANIDVVTLDVTYDGASFVGIDANLILRSGSVIDRLNGCRIEIGGRTEEWSLKEGVPVDKDASGGHRYQLSVLIPDIDPDVPSFRLILMGGKGDRVARTYTFAIPHAAS